MSQSSKGEDGKIGVSCQCQAVAEDDSEDQRVVYRDSPRHQDCSGQQHSMHSAGASASRSDMDLIRQRLISAVQRPHAPSGAIGVITGTPATRPISPSADPLSLRYPSPQ